MQVNYFIVAQIISLLTAILFFWSLILVLYRYFKSNNGLRSFYAAFLPYIIHGCIYSILVQYWRLAEKSIEMSLITNVWSATVRLHLIVTLLVFVYSYKPQYEWYEMLNKKIDKINGTKK